MDDLFRLLDCRQQQRAMESFEALSALDPPIYSLNHDRRLREMSPQFVAHQIGQRCRASQSRSAQVKTGLAARDEDIRPSRRAIRKAVAVRKRWSDLRAHHAMKEIERVRDTMPAGDRSNLRAIAGALNAADVATPSGCGTWQGSMVKRVFDRLGRSLDE